MSTGAVIAIAIGALLLIALIVFVVTLGRRRRVDVRRDRAGEIRQEAEARELHASRERATADEQAARASQLEAEAQEKAAAARRQSAEATERAEAAEGERRFARERHEEALSVDPDVTDDDAGGEAADERSVAGGASGQRDADRHA